VVGPATYQCKEILKAHGARWAKDEKGWTFMDDYSRAVQALNECAGKINGILEEGSKPKTEGGDTRKHSCAREISKTEGYVKLGPYNGSGDYADCPVCGKVYRILN